MCSESTGNRVAPLARTSAINIAPAQTSASLLASATVLPASSAAQVLASPALPTIAAKTALHALQGDVLPQYVSVPIPLVEHPDFKAGENFFPDLTDNFFTPNEFPPCNVNITATEIMAKSEADQ